MNTRDLYLIAIIATTMSYTYSKTTTISPSDNISEALTTMAPGDTVFLKNGTYNISSTILLGQKGSEDKKLVILSVKGEKPVLNFSTQPYGADNRGILLTGDYYYIKGLEICYAGDNGIKIEGNHNTIDFCVLHHNGDSGIQLGFGHKFEDSNPGISSNNGTFCAHNTIKNCDSYLNFDFDNNGGDADGFACKMHNGKGNMFIGCRAWRNSDDGWDLYETDYAVEIYSCWTWHNGDVKDFIDIYEEYITKTGKSKTSYQGNGNGFKLGGNGTGGSSKGTHTTKNCIAFENNKSGSVKGFDQNSHDGGVIIHNCLGFNNGYNYSFKDNSEPENEFKNNVSIKFKPFNDCDFKNKGIHFNNSWDPSLNVTADTNDYISLSEKDAIAPRQENGGLPNNGFGRLKKGSDLIDKGIDVGLLKYGSAPDLGPFEYGIVGVNDHTAKINVPKTARTITNKTLIISGSKASLTGYDLYTINGTRIRSINNRLFSDIKCPGVQGIYILKKRSMGFKK